MQLQSEREQKIFSVYNSSFFLVSTKILSLVSCSPSTVGSRTKGLIFVTRTHCAQLQQHLCNENFFLSRKQSTNTQDSATHLFVKFNTVLQFRRRQVKEICGETLHIQQERRSFQTPGMRERARRRANTAPAVEPGSPNSPEAIAGRQLRCLSPCVTRAASISREAKANPKLCNLPNT